MMVLICSAPIRRQGKGDLQFQASLSQNKNKSRTKLRGEEGGQTLAQEAGGCEPCLLLRSHYLPLLNFGFQVHQVGLIPPSISHPILQVQSDCVGKAAPEGVRAFCSQSLNCICSVCSQLDSRGRVHSDCVLTLDMEAQSLATTSFEPFPL